METQPAHSGAADRPAALGNVRKRVQSVASGKGNTPLAKRQGITPEPLSKIVATEETNTMTRNEKRRRDRAKTRGLELRRLRTEKARDRKLLGTALDCAEKSRDELDKITNQLLEPGLYNFNSGDGRRVRVLTLA